MLGFITGIRLFSFGEQLGHGLWILAFSFLAFILAAILRREYRTALATGVAGMLTFVVLGFSATHASIELNQLQHITHLPTEPSHYKGVVSDYVLQVEQVQVNGTWRVAAGKVQLSVPHVGAGI